MWVITAAGDRSSEVGKGGQRDKGLVSYLESEIQVSVTHSRLRKADQCFEDPHSGVELGRTPHPSSPHSYSSSIFCPHPVTVNQGSSRPLAPWSFTTSHSKGYPFRKSYLHGVHQPSELVLTLSIVKQREKGHIQDLAAS